MKDEEKLSLWEAVCALWGKYCGVADEYKMLRDRWLYLQDSSSLSVLPDIKPSFNRMDDLVNDLEELFKRLNFNRDEGEKYEKFYISFRSIKDPNYFNRTYGYIKRVFFDLAAYTGILKLAFFQRTVSSEIAHVASGMPHSPERTIGNELFYLSADKAAQSYCDCLIIKDIKWDKLITFIPPIGRGRFHGAFFWPFTYLPIFHVSMSEEQKYIIGAYLGLAHEFGHASCRDNPQAMRMADEIVKVPPILLPEDVLRYLFYQLLADLVAVQIGGINTAEALLDELFTFMFVYTLSDEPGNGRNPNFWDETLQTIWRISGILSYLKQAELYKSSRKRLERRLQVAMEMTHNFLDVLQEEKDADKREIENKSWRLNAFEEIGTKWGYKIARIDKTYRTGTKKGRFSFSIKRDHLFEIDKGSEKRIINSLRKGVSCPDEDPRFILHAFFEAYKQGRGKKRPNYAAAIHSLAFNTFKKKRRKK